MLMPHALLIELNGTKRSLYRSKSLEKVRAISMLFDANESTVRSFVAGALERYQTKDYRLYVSSDIREISSAPFLKRNYASLIRKLQEVERGKRR